MPSWFAKENKISLGYQTAEKNQLANSQKTNLICKQLTKNKLDQFANIKEKSKPVCTNHKKKINDAKMSEIAQMVE